MALKLCELLKLKGVDLSSFKIHLATSDTHPPLIAYFEGRFKQWQEYQHLRNFPCRAIVSLIALTGDKWLFVGVWNVQGAKRRTHQGKSWWEYVTDEVPGLEDLNGRTIVYFKRTFRAAYLRGPAYGEQLEVTQILEDRMSMVDFPGYSSVLLTFAELRHVTQKSLGSWRAALSSVAGIYLVTDSSCGKLYVGSAYGAEGIWGRWSAYANTTHGNNVELRQLIAKMGDGHAQHFQFSILEIRDVMEGRDEVLARESHWKNVLRSREHGYNSN